MTVSKDESEVFIQGLGIKTKEINDLLEKLKEAESIANKISKTQIVINDKRQKDVIEYVKEVRQDFIESFGHEPIEYCVVAVGDFRESRICLNL